MQSHDMDRLLKTVIPCASDQLDHLVQCITDRRLLEGVVEKEFEVQPKLRKPRLCRSDACRVIEPRADVTQPTLQVMSQHTFLFLLGVPQVFEGNPPLRFRRMDRGAMQCRSAEHHVITYLS